MVILSQCTHISNHYIVQFILQLFVSYTSIKQTKRKAINVISHIKLKREYHMLISTDAEKLLGGIQSELLIKRFSKLKIDWASLILIRDIHEQFTVNIIFNGKRFLSASPFNIVLEVVAINEHPESKS